MQRVSEVSNHKCLRESSHGIINWVAFFPGGISLVIQRCLYAISSGMIALNVIRLSTFLGWAGREKVLPFTQNGPLQRHWQPPQQKH